jgi:hypothetical protein
MCINIYIYRDFDIILYSKNIGVALNYKHDGPLESIRQSKLWKKTGLTHGYWGNTHAGIHNVTMHCKLNQFAQNNQLG